jgi:hypothetical protein
VSFVRSTNGLGLLFGSDDSTCPTGLATIIFISILFSKERKNPQLQRNEGRISYNVARALIVRRTIEVGRVLGDFWGLGLLADDGLRIPVNDVAHRV